MILTEPVNPWLLPAVADAQLELVCQQLEQDAQGNPPAPFAAFHRAMKFLMKREGNTFSLLDVGCGAGHYGHLIDRDYQYIGYEGTDLSAEMIERAIRFYHEQKISEPQYAPFRQCAFEDNDFGSFDVVFVSQALETTSEPVANLRLVLDKARQYVFLHRLRVPLVSEPSRRIMERTYLGLMAPNMEWNQAEVLEIARQYGEIIYTDVWDVSLTTIVEKP